MTRAKKILKSLNLSHHAKIFDDSGIKSSEDVQLLSREDLLALGVVKIGERNRICAWIENQKIISSKTIHSSLKYDAVDDTKNCTQNNEDKVAIVKRICNIVNQGTSFIGNQQHFGGPSTAKKVPKRLSDPGRQQRPQKQRVVPLLINQKSNVEGSFSKLEMSPCSHKSEENTAKNIRSSQSNHQSFLKQRSLLMKEVHTEPIPSPSSQTSEGNTAEKLTCRAQRSDPCKRHSSSKKTSTKLSIAQYDYKENSPPQMMPLPCNQTIEDIFKEKTELMVECYMSGSDFSLVPDAAECKNCFCHDLLLILMLDMKIVNILAKKFCDIWLNVAANKNKLTTKKATDRNQIVDNAIRDFSKIAHCYCHENAVVLCSLPEGVVTKSLHEFRKIALACACKKSVENSQGKTPNWSHKSLPRRSKLDPCVPLQRRALSEGNQPSLPATKESKISPQEAYHFWESECSSKSPNGIFPQMEPHYKADDPLVHPKSSR